MQRFAFIVHPIDARRDVSRKYPIAKFLPNRSIEWYIKKRDPLIVADAIGIRSITGEEARGWFIACPLTPRQLVSLPLDFVWNKLEQCGQTGSGSRGRHTRPRRVHVRCRRWRADAGETPARYRHYNRQLVHRRNGD